MKKVALGVMFLLLALFSISAAEAVEIKLSKEVYAPQETLQAEIYGNFIDSIEINNIHFYRERNIPVEYDLLKLPGKYLLYALLPTTEGNYTLAIEDIRYEEDSIMKSDDIVKQFKIIKSNETIVQVAPGFVVARQDFSIKVEASKNIDIQASFLNQTQTVPLLEGKPKRIDFSIQGVSNYTETSISIAGYSIPVFIFPNKTEEINETPKFRFNRLNINTSIAKMQLIQVELAIVNFGLKNVTSANITYNSTSNVSGLIVSIAPNSFENLLPQEQELMNISIFSDNEGNFSGKIIAESENITAELDIFIQVVENITDIPVEDDDSTEYTVKNQTCAGLGGRICTADETCSIPQVPSENGLCCTGECRKEEKKKDNSWIYGLLLIIALVGGLIGASYYMKKKQGKPFNFLKKKEDSFKERMVPTPSPSTEVSGSLSKI